MSAAPALWSGQGRALLVVVFGTLICCQPSDLSWYKDIPSIADEPRLAATWVLGEDSPQRALSAVDGDPATGWQLSLGGTGAPSELFGLKSEAGVVVAGLVHWLGTNEIGHEVVVTADGEEVLRYRIGPGGHSVVGGLSIRASSLGLAVAKADGPQSVVAIGEWIPFDSYGKPISPLEGGLLASRLVKLGDVVWTAGVKDVATRVWGLAVASNSQNPLARIKLGYGLMEQGHSAPAREQLEAALALDSSNSVALLNLVDLEQRLGNARQAKLLLDEIDPQNLDRRLRSSYDHLSTRQQGSRNREVLPSRSSQSWLLMAFSIVTAAVMIVLRTHRSWTEVGRPVRTMVWLALTLALVPSVVSALIERELLSLALQQARWLLPVGIIGLPLIALCAAIVVVQTSSARRHLANLIGAAKLPEHDRSG